MEANESISGTGIVDVVINDPIPPEPAPGADAQKPIPDATDDNATPEEADTPEQQEVKKQSKFARRLDRQKTARIAAETELRLTKERLAEFEAKAAKSAPESGEPKESDFTDYAEYQRAINKYDAAQLLDEKLKSRDEASQSRDRQGKATAEQEQAAKAWVEREKTFQAATKDYEAVVMPYVEEDLGSLSQGARQLIVDSQVGPALLHHLASNPEVADRIAELSHIRQVVELGKLEATMSAPPSRKASNAPPPPNPNNGSRSAAKGYSDNMSDSEYREWRKTQGARWAR